MQRPSIAAVLPQIGRRDRDVGVPGIGRCSAGYGVGMAPETPCPVEVRSPDCVTALGRVVLPAPTRIHEDGAEPLHTRRPAEFLAKTRRRFLERVEQVLG